MYYFFNESNKAETRTATVAGHGAVQDWDLGTGEIHPMAAAAADGPDMVKFPLVLGPYEAKVVVVGPLPKESAAPEPSFAAGTTFAELTGDWNVDLSGKPLTTALKSWEDLGTTGFSGPATYRKQFTAAAAPKGKHVYLEIGDVHDYAKVTLNGKDLGAHAWQPYRWDVTSALKPGENDLVVEVDATAAGRGPGAPPPAAAPAAPAPGLATAPPPAVWGWRRRTPQKRRPRCRRSRASRSSRGRRRTRRPRTTLLRPARPGRAGHPLNPRITPRSPTASRPLGFRISGGALRIRHCNCRDLRRIDEATATVAESVQMNGSRGSFEHDK